MEETMLDVQVEMYIRVCVYQREIAHAGCVCVCVCVCKSQTHFHTHTHTNTAHISHMATHIDPDTPDASLESVFRFPNNGLFPCLSTGRPGQQPQTIFQATNRLNLENNLTTAHRIPGQTTPSNHSMKGREIESEFMSAIKQEEFL